MRTLVDSDRKTEDITHEEQLARWVAGDPVHMAPTQDKETGWCCPDFSCCQPRLLAPVEIRQAYAAASEPERVQFLGGFMMEAISLANQLRVEDGLAPVEVHIAGRGEPQ